VSPPDLPNPNIHYQPFGQLLSLVQSGRRFRPITPQHIDDRTVPEYSFANGVSLPSSQPFSFARLPWV